MRCGALMTDLGVGRLALIVIDLQIGMFDGVKFPPLVGAAPVLANVRRLIDWARARQAPVIFVRHDGAAHEALAPAAPGWPLHPDLGRRDNEAIISKSVGDAFATSDLASRLRVLDVGCLVLCGAQTDACVGDTLAGALREGFGVIVAADAHATWDWAGETAAQIVARHNIVFAKDAAGVVSTAEIVAAQSLHFQKGSLPGNDTWP